MCWRAAQITTQIGPSAKNRRAFLLRVGWPLGCRRPNPRPLRGLNSTSCLLDGQNLVFFEIVQILPVWAVCTSAQNRRRRHGPLGFGKYFLIICRQDNSIKFCNALHNSGPSNGRECLYVLYGLILGGDRRK